jgi:phosphoribosylaminoimidazolecarboxamide formyltransferase / IMP cyclohydrolase
MPRIRRALISVSDKRDIVAFARALRELDVELISTGGTHAALTQAGITAVSVSEVTGFPEILDGRVKTLHPKIHGGLLAIADNPLHTGQLQEHHIDAIDLLVVNLYPFEQTVARDGVTLADAVEQIDIGGPAMIRAAAKNYRHKAVVVNPARYPAILEELRAGGGVIAEDTCFVLAREVFRHTAAYDGAIASYLERSIGKGGRLPEVLTISLRKELELRYGENPHQQGALYGSFGSLFSRLHGKELSYNNIVDIAAAALLVSDFDEPTAAIIKHTNPCGVGSGPMLLEAYERALATDGTSAFGGIIAVNRPLDLAAAARMNEIFSEVIVAPAFADGVLTLLRKKKDRRIIQLTADLRTLQGPDIRSVPGGMLVQDADRQQPDPSSFRVVTRRAPTTEEWQAMLYAWRVARHVKSNAIVYATADRTVGIGAGQMSRVDSAKLAAAKAAAAGLSVRGTAVASDAFFPFVDGLLEAVHAGSTAVIQPGGSIRDEEVIRAADENNLAMVFTGTRHFKH